jgi:hypothetical protein
MITTVALPCSAQPKCAGINPGDWAWFHGTAFHAIGGCKDASGRAIPHMRDEAGGKKPPTESA